METTENAQLTWYETIYFDHGTRMALLLFNDKEEPSQEECHAVRMHNAFERTSSNSVKTRIKKDLTKTMAQMENCSNV